MKVQDMAAGYSICVGISMITMWIMFYVMGSIPELQTRTAEIGLHIIGEIVTALSLIVGGYALLTKKWWGLQAYSLSMGMLLYTLIVSPGYYIQKGELGFVLMFGTLFLFALIFVVLSFLHRDRFLSNG